jgi:hypothetical protein
MSSEKAELKISIYQEEIEEYKKKAEGAKEQRIMWSGYGKAMEEVRALYNETFRQIQLAMTWLKLSDKEKEKLPESEKPFIEMTEEQGALVAKLIRPVLDQITRKTQKSKQEPESFSAKEDAYRAEIQRLERLISYQEEQIRRSELDAGERIEDEDEKQIPDPDASSDPVPELPEGQSYPQPIKKARKKK